MSERTVHKTIRITPEIFDYIDNQNGNNWNDKVNNAFSELIHGKEQREIQLATVSELIIQRKETLKSLDEVIQTAKRSLGVSRWC